MLRQLRRLLAGPEPVYSLPTYRAKADSYCGWPCGMGIFKGYIVANHPEHGVIHASHVQTGYR